MDLLNIKTKKYTVTGKDSVDLSDHPTKLKKPLCGKSEYKNVNQAFMKEIDNLQNVMYAHDRYGMLLIFQAMDGAGKDGTIRHVMSGVNPHGVRVFAFKQPSSDELDHDFMWRTNRMMASRGTITIFNRSYYEEVLVTKVHPNIITDIQRLPDDRKNLKTIWKERYKAIRNLESYLNENGIVVLKFFLHLSKDEQKERFLSRLNTPSKNWKFSESDVKERAYWDKYQAAYQDAINATATKEAPWFIVPADDKISMRLIVSQIVVNKLRSLKMAYPKMDEKHHEDLIRYQVMLEQEAD
jgi:PPK2 family polyphosphate:nucleotide phosphotransferase